jgi:two-component system phosphate regulon sensor histidine kinase PhoR
MARTVLNIPRSVRSKSRTRTIALILTVIVVLPALVYSVFELNTLTTSEAMISEIYRRQMDAILFSLNQHTMDVVTAWASGIGNAAGAPSKPSSGSAAGPLEIYLRNRPAIEAVFFGDSALTGVSVLPAHPDSPWRNRSSALAASLTAMKGTLDRLWSASRLDYRKIEPFRVPGPEGNRDACALVFVRDGEPGRQSLGGMVLNEDRFIRDIVLTKSREIAGSEFVIAIQPDSGKGEMVATGDVRPEEIRQRARIWMLPQHTIGIRLQGASLEEILVRRFQSNLLLILLLDVVLIAGAWVVFRSTKKEMELAALKSDFVSNVSHELRTPLALIRMYAETLEMGRLKNEGKKREYYSTILHETERLSRLVNNVLNFARMESGRKEYHFSPLDLNDIVASVLQTYEFHLQGEGFKPVTELSAVPVRARADREALVEAVINVVDNAVKYSGDEKYLRIATRATDGSGIIEIEDHGVGIPPEYHGKIYDTFFRVPGSFVRTKKGSGLGLTLVKHIVEAHGGSISLTSRVGKGSTFRLGFPLEPST